MEGVIAETTGAELSQRSIDSGDQIGWNDEKWRNSGGFWADPRQETLPEIPWLYSHNTNSAAPIGSLFLII